MTTPSHDDALEIAQQLVTDEYDTGITEESFLARAIALIEPKLRERDERIAQLEIKIMGQEEQLKALVKTDCGFGGYVDSLVNDLHAAREDSELIDWLEKEHVHFIGYSPCPDMGGNQWSVRVTSDYRRPAAQRRAYRTLREAVRAARQSHKETEL